MKKINKKGFTIVELVIVIAVIAILAAVLIPTFSSLVKTAQTSSDVNLVKNLNTSLTTSEILDGKNETITDALNDVKEDGFDVTKLTPTNSDNEILWDEESNRFVLYVDEEYESCGSDVEVDESKLYKLWKIYNEVEELESNPVYSIYWNVDADLPEGTKLSVGFDAGTTKNVSEIFYENTSSEAKEVVIRTNSYDTALVVNAPLDTVHHYGELMSANLQKVSITSYYEHGDTNLVEIASGRLVITNDTNAKVDNVYLTATNDNYKVEEVGIIIATQTGAKLPDVIRRDAVTEEDGKVVCVIQTNVDANGENPQKVDNVTIKGEDNVQEATNGYTNVADLTKMVLEAPTNSEVEGASEFIGNDVTVTTEEKQGVINEAKGTVIEVTFHDEVTLLTISEFRDQWNAGKFYDTANPASVKLTGNVDMKKIGNWGPIGTWEYPFFGTFDGKKNETENYTISYLSNHANADIDGNYTHIYYNNSNVGYGETYGFFGIVGNGNCEIKNITFDNVDINIVNGKNVGAVIGYVPKLNASYDGHSISSVGTVTLTNITVSGSVSANSHVAGIVGKVYSASGITFTNCANNASVTASGSRAGGLAATIQNMSNATLIDCSNTGAISGDGYAAGLVAYSHTSTNVSLTNCSNSGNINCNTGSGRAGGLLGTAGNASHSIIFDNCSNSGKVYGLVQAGGLIGSVGNGGQAAPITLKNEISNTGEIKAGNYAGGILCSQTAAGDGAGIYKSLTIDSSATFVTTGDVITTEVGGVTGTYWVFKYQTSYYYCNSATKTGTLAE